MIKANPKNRIAIIGAGPTGLYTLNGLSKSKLKLDITIFERQSVGGVGYPYGRLYNSRHMLSNISSLEIPPLTFTLYDWLKTQPEYKLRDWGIDPQTISKKAYYSRIALGAYLRDQFELLVNRMRVDGHDIFVRYETEVADIRPIDGRYDIVLGLRSEVFGDEVFDYVVLATGHYFPPKPEKEDQFLLPGQKIIELLPFLKPSRIGILGSSLSAIDATVAIAMRWGKFHQTPNGVTFRALPDAQSLNIQMMSRTGLLPEADFYFPIPLGLNRVFTDEALHQCVLSGSSGLLNRIFALFKAEIQDADPSYARNIGIERLTVETFAKRHLRRRRRSDPFVYAETNLKEAAADHAACRTVGWRVAILRCHELFGKAVVYFDDDDLQRFNRYMRAVFIDNYASVPLLSIARLLALHDAGHLSVVALGNKYKISNSRRGIDVSSKLKKWAFSTVIDARGQMQLHINALPFPVLRMEILKALTQISGQGTSPRALIDDDASLKKLGSKFGQLFFWALPFLLHRHPFIQGLTASHEIGEKMATRILSEMRAVS